MRRGAASWPIGFGALSLIITALFLHGAPLYRVLALAGGDSYRVPVAPLPRQGPARQGQLTRRPECWRGGHRHDIGGRHSTSY